MARSSLLLWGFSFYFVLVVLVVPIICQKPPGPPVITRPDIIKNGETVTITCSSTGGDPTPTVKWLRNNVVLDETSTTSGGVTRNEYTFTASPAEHLRIFECQTDNGVLQNPLTINVLVIVYISPQTPTLTGASNLAPNQQSTWTCTSTGGYPTPTMTMRIGNNQFSTSEFTTTSVAVNGAKSYTVTGTLNWSPTIGNNGQTLFCDVAHPATLNTPQTVSLPLTVIGALSVSVTPATQSAVNGDNSVVIQCTVSGIPQATSWSWTFSPLGSNSQTTIAQGTNNGDYTVSNSNTNPHLTIKTIKAANAGDYICRATNVVGTSSSQQSRLTVTGAVLSISISPPSALVIQGTNQQIVCTVQGTPAAQSISWTRNGAPIAINNSKYTGGNTANPSLTINNFQSSDAGNYVCSATNAAGTSTSSVSSLTYEAPSTTPGNSSGRLSLGISIPTIIIAAVVVWLRNQITFS